MADINFSDGREIGLSVKQGDTFGPWGLGFTQTGFDWSDSGGTSIKMQVRSKPLADPALIDVSPVPIYPTLGEMQISIEVSGALTGAIPAGKYYYDIEITRPDGSIRTVIYGQFVIEQDVTR